MLIRVYTAVWHFFLGGGASVNIFFKNKFHYLVYFYNSFHIFEKNPYGRNKKKGYRNWINITYKTIYNNT